MPKALLAKTSPDNAPDDLVHVMDRASQYSALITGQAWHTHRSVITDNYLVLSLEGASGPPRLEEATGRTHPSCLSRTFRSGRTKALHCKHEFKDNTQNHSRICHMRLSPPPGIFKGLRAGQRKARGLGAKTFGFLAALSSSCPQPPPQHYTTSIPAKERSQRGQKSGHSGN